MRRLFLVFAILLCAVCSAAAFPIKGKVVDTNGKPVAGIRVDVTERPTQIWGSKAAIRETVFTDKAGAFKLKEFDIKPGAKTYPPTLTFVAHQPGKLLGWRMEHIGHLVYTGKTDELAKGITIVVAKPVTVEGKVTDESGRPIPGAKVQADSFSSKKPGNTSYARADDLCPAIEYRAVVTDDSGIYRIASVPEHTAPSVIVSKPGLAMIPQDRNAAQSLNTVMVPGGSMSGRVVDGKGGGVSGALISMSSYSMSGTHNGWGTAISRKDGSFVVDGLVPAEYHVTTYPVRDDHIQFRQSGVKIKAGETLKLPDILSPPSVYVTGRVVDADTGKPIAGAQIGAGSESFHGSIVTTDKEGNYSVQVLPGDVMVYYAGGNPMYLRDWKADQKTVSVPETGLRGHIIKLKSNGQCKGKVVGADGKPVAGITVSIGRDPGEAKCVTNSKGEFALGLPPDVDLSGG